MKMMPCSSPIVAAGNPIRRCTSPPAAPTPPSSTAIGTIASGLCRARKEIRMPVKP